MASIGSGMAEWKWLAEFAVLPDVQCLIASAFRSNDYSGDRASNMRSNSGEP